MKKYQFWAIILILLGIALINMNTFDLVVAVRYDTKAPFELWVPGVMAVFTGIVIAITGSVTDKE